MTDDTLAPDEFNEDEYANARQARIDRMVANRGSEFNAAAGLGVTVAPERTNYRYNTHNDTFTNLDTGDTVPASEVERLAAEHGDTGRVHDNGVSIEFALQRLTAERKRLSDRLTESSFDQKTGARVFALQGADRRAAEQQLAAFDKMAAEQVKDYARLKKQRDDDRAAAEQTAVDEANTREFIRREAIAKALQMRIDAEAEQINAEFNRRKGRLL